MVASESVLGDVDRNALVTQPSVPDVVQQFTEAPWDIERVAVVSPPADRLALKILRHVLKVAVISFVGRKILLDDARRPLGRVMIQSKAGNSGSHSASLNMVSPKPDSQVVRALYQRPFVLCKVWKIALCERSDGVVVPAKIWNRGAFSLAPNVMTLINMPYRWGPQTVDNRCAFRQIRKPSSGTKSGSPNQQVCPPIVLLPT